MSEVAKHTPGPWKWSKRNASPYMSSLSGVGCDVLYSDEYAGASWIEINEADASLIAAAPELLEALKEAAELIDHYTHYDASGALAVIAKAEGRS